MYDLKLNKKLSSLIHNIKGVFFVVYGVSHSFFSNIDSFDNSLKWISKIITIVNKVRHSGIQNQDSSDFVEFLRKLCGLKLMESLLICYNPANLLCFGTGFIHHK